MEPNKELLLAVLEEIEKFPETHYQARWFKPLATPVPGPKGELCGTAYCFAGHAAVMSGAEVPPVAKLEARGLDASEVDWYVDPKTLASTLVHFASETAASVPVEHYAKDILRLDPESANCLFTARNSREILRELVEHIIEHGRVSSWERTKMLDAEWLRLRMV